LVYLLRIGIGDMQVLKLKVVHVSSRERRPGLSGISIRQ
jgi:hypothetical protein